jgi:hypothetical protein
MPLNRKDYHYYSMRFTQAEHDKLHARASERGISMAKFIIQLCIQLPDEELASVWPSVPAWRRGDERRGVKRGGENA